MRQHVAHPSNLAVFRRILVCCLLLTSIALPLQAWAVDTDGDGYDDAVDVFPNDAAAAVDTDHDGKPDFYLATTLDLDADNDGVPNYIDASPLNAAIHSETTLPVNNTYKGGQVREVQSRQ